MALLLSSNSATESLACRHRCSSTCRKGSRKSARKACGVTTLFPCWACAAPSLLGIQATCPSTLATSTSTTWRARATASKCRSASRSCCRSTRAKRSNCHSRPISPWPGCSACSRSAPASGGLTAEWWTTHWLPLCQPTSWRPAPARCPGRRGKRIFIGSSSSSCSSCWRWSWLAPSLRPNVFTNSAWPMWPLHLLSTLNFVLD